MPLPFETVREKLLRAGIAPRHVSRYVTELREHLADLTAHERASGSDAKLAADHAKALLGGDAELAQAMIDKGAPRALAARAPWAVFAVLPMALFVAMFCATAFSLSHRLSPLKLPESYHGLIAVVSIVANLVGPLLMAGCITVALRQRLASRWVWIGLSLFALFSGLFGFQIHVIPAHGGHEGGTFFSAIRMVYWHDHWSTIATFGMASLRAAVLFAMAATAYRFLRARLMPLHT